MFIRALLRYIQHSSFEVLNGVEWLESACESIPALLALAKIGWREEGCGLYPSISMISLFSPPNLSLEPLLVYVCCVCIVVFVCVLIAHNTDDHANPIKVEALNGITLYVFCFIMVSALHRRGLLA